MEAVILGIGMALFGLVAGDLFRRWSRNKQRQTLVLFGFAAVAVGSPGRPGPRARG